MSDENDRNKVPSGAEGHDPPHHEVAVSVGRTAGVPPRPAPADEGDVVPTPKLVPNKRPAARPPDPMADPSPAAPVRGTPVASATPTISVADGGVPPAAPPAEPVETAEPPLPSMDDGPPATAYLEAVQRLETSFRDSMAGLEHAIAVRRKEDRFREDQVAELHRELQQYRGQIIERTARPLVTGMIQVHDDIGKVLSALATDDPAKLTPARLIGLIEHFQTSIEIVLVQNGIESYSEPSTEFNPRRQKALATVPAPDEASVGKVARSMRPGFERNDEILQKERVELYVAPVAAIPPAEPAPAAETTRNEEPESPAEQPESATGLESDDG